TGYLSIKFGLFYMASYLNISISLFFVASEKGLFSVVINMQVPGSTHYSMVFYFVTNDLVPDSLLQRFVDGDDEFRNSRLKLIPSVPKGSWIVRQIVGSTPCLLGKAVDCNYIRGPSYLEVDVDIGSSTVANAVLGLVIGVITTLVVDMAFLVQISRYMGYPGGGFNISPLKPRNGRPRTRVQHLMQMDLKGWGVGYVSSFQQHCLLHMLNSVTGLREWFSQTDERSAPPRIPVMVNMASASVPSKKNQKLNDSSVNPNPSLDQMHAANRNSVMMDEYSDEDEEFQIAESEQEAYPNGMENDVRRTVLEEEPAEQIDLSCFSGNLRHDDRDNARDCWRISDGNNFRVRSKRFCYDKSKIPAGKHLMDLVAVDWFKDTKRMDHVAKRQGCAAQVASEKGLFSVVINMQVPGSTHYSMVFYFVTNELKLIPSVPKGSWIVRQSVGSTPCLLGKAVDCNYIRGPSYLEVDVDIGSSTVANGVLGLVIGVITTLVVDMAFLVQANTTDELPERLIGAIRISHLELSSAIVPKLEPDPS
ncbi:protein ENHANCED DISEASE RESISTANCE 2-like, partial [Quillaja saponaria]